MQKKRKNLRELFSGQAQNKGKCTLWGKKLGEFCASWKCHKEHCPYLFVWLTASTYSHIRHFHLPYLESFRNRGWKVCVACGGSDPELPFADVTMDLPFEKSMGSPANFRAAQMLRGNMAKERYDLVITHTSLAAFFTRLAVLGMRRRPAVINMAHGYLFDDATGFVKKQILLTAERLTAPCTDLLLTMNHWDYETAKRCRLGKQVENVPGIGVDFSRLQKADDAEKAALRRELGIPEDRFVLFYAAEFSGRKSQSVLIRAMERLPEDVLLILGGDGVLLEACKTLAKRLGVADRVLFPGYLKNVGDWYGAADAAVSASRSEGLPFNIMEAMYTGLPVVASNVKGHEDLIDDGEDGLLYPYGDDAACARQIRRLMEEPALGRALAAAAQERVLDYGLEQVLPVVMSAYGSVVELGEEQEAALV